MKALLIVLVVINALMGFGGLIAGTTQFDRIIGAIGFLDICVLLGALHVANVVRDSVREAIKATGLRAEQPAELPIATPR